MEDLVGNSLQGIQNDEVYSIFYTNSGDSIFAETGSFWATTNDIQVTGSLNVSGSTIIGSGSIHTNNPEILHVENSGSFNVTHIQGNSDTYLQVNVKNLSGAAGASSDYVATADNGTEDLHYVNMGINSSGFDNEFSVGYQNDAYLINRGRDLYIGSLDGPDYNHTHVHLFSSNSWQDPQISIISDKKIGFNTGSVSTGFTYEFSGSVKLQDELKVDGSVTASYFIGDGSLLTNLPQLFAETGSFWATTNSVQITGSLSVTSPSELTVGESKYGGIVAYILQPTDSGYDSEYTKGFVVSSDNVTQDISTWGCFGSLISGADGSVIGTGQQNTLDIITGCNDLNTAAKVCNDYSITVDGTVYNDWFLPSIDELNQIYLNKNTIGGIPNGNYWSSTENNANTAKVIFFDDGTIYNVNKNNYSSISVRAVREFSVPVTPSLELNGETVINGNLSTTGITTLSGIIEDVTVDGGFSGNKDFDFTSGSIFYLTGITGNGVWNVNNVPTTDNKALSLTYVIEQGVTPYSGSQYQINGSSVTVNWVDNTVPTGSANNTEIIGLTAFRVGSTWNVVGSLSTFGI